MSILLDLFFVLSVLFVFGLCASIAIYALRGRLAKASRSAVVLGGFVACYAVVLISVALLRPRRMYAPGQRRCFDDWCVSAIGVQRGPGATGAWVADIELFSDAKRVRQRARDASAELEDQEGRRYAPAAEPLIGADGARHWLNEELGPGESFHVLLPFQLPEHAEPAGLVIHHGDFPGSLIIGADQSILHPPALLRFSSSL